MEKALLVINTNLVMSENTRESLQHAATRWNCDYIEHTDKGDFLYHGAALKLKAFEICEGYDRVFVIDSDTVIRSDAPNIFDLVPENEVGAVRNQQPHHPPIYQVANINIAARDIQQIIQRSNITEPIDIVNLSHNFFNSGVLVWTRKYHEDVLSYALKLFLESGGVQWWDQIPLNIAVLLKIGSYTDLGMIWNLMFPFDFNKMNAYIYHFAGNPSRYEILRTVNWRI